MESRTCLSFFFIAFMSFLLSSQAYIFSVGGRDGWVVKPSDAYGPWSGRNRFLINDTLVFKYNSATDSVLIVNKQDYESCSVSNPILKLEGGDSRYLIDRSGPFYFITGNQSNCQNGQKLLIVVLSPRTGTPPATPPPASPPGVAPVSPPGSAPSPSTAPGPAPASTPGSAPSPSTSPGPAPASTPGASPSPSTAPGTVPSASPPGAPITPSGADSPGGSGGNTPGGATGDTAPNSFSPRLSSSKGFALGLSLLVTLALGSSLRSF